MPGVPAEIRDRMRQLPELAPLDHESFNALADRALYRRLPAGARFIVEHSDAEAVFFVLDGEIKLLVDERTVKLEKAPTTIGLLSILDGAPRTASVEAFSDVGVVMVERGAFEGLMADHPLFVARIISHLTEEIRTAQRRDEVARHAFDDHFHSPNARLVQGPYVMANFPMTALVMETTPERIAACLPSGLRPVPGMGARYLLTLNDFSAVFSEHPSAAGRSFAYRETTPFIPVLGPGGRVWVFSPELYLDSYMPIVLGRELYGFPKRYGVARFAPRHVDLHIGDALAFRASWNEARPTDAGEVLARLQLALLGSTRPPVSVHAGVMGGLFGLMDRPALRDWWPPMPVLVHSQVPDGRAGGDAMRIDELVEIPFHVRTVSDFEILEGAELQDFEDWILPGEVVAGVRLRMEASFGRARRPLDYAAAARIRERVRRSRLPNLRRLVSRFGPS